MCPPPLLDRQALTSPQPCTKRAKLAVIRPATYRPLHWPCSTDPTAKKTGPTPAHRRKSPRAIPLTWTRSDRVACPQTRQKIARRDLLKHSCVAEQAVVDFQYDCRLAAVVVHHVAAAGDSGALGALIEQPIRRVSAQPVSKHSMTNGFWTVRTENMHLRSWRLQLQAAVLMPRRFTRGQDVTDGTQSGYVGLFVGWIGHSQVDIDDILSR